MITIRVEAIKEVEERLRQAQEQAPYALSRACNDMAFLIRDAEMVSMRKVFDRPKEQTVRNIRVFKGTKDRPGATIAFQQIYQGDEYMVPEVEGGARSMKPSEKRLGRYYAPGKGAKMDKYGNMQGGQITQILSQLGRFGEVGYLMNQTARSAGRRRGAAKSTEYFMVSQKTGGLLPGVYKRTQSGVGFGGRTSRTLPSGSFQKGASSGKFSSVIRGRGVSPVMIFTNKAPTYRKRFPFFDVGQYQIGQHFAPLVNKWVTEALRTRR